MRSLEAENKKRRELAETRSAGEGVWGGGQNGERGGEPRSQLVPKALDLFGL